MARGWEPLLEQVARERYPRLVARAMLLVPSRSDAEDLVQEALVATFTARARFESVGQADVDAESSSMTLLGPADPLDVRPWPWSGTRVTSGVVAFSGTTETYDEWTGCSRPPPPLGGRVGQTGP